MGDEVNLGPNYGHLNLSYMVTRYSPALLSLPPMETLNTPRIVVI